MDGFLKLDGIHPRRRIPGKRRRDWRQCQFQPSFRRCGDAYGDVFVADSQNNAIRLGVRRRRVAHRRFAKSVDHPVQRDFRGGRMAVGWRFFFPDERRDLVQYLPGSHTINFAAASGYTSPAVQSIPRDRPSNDPDHGQLSNRRSQRRLTASHPCPLPAPPMPERNGKWTAAPGRLTRALSQACPWAPTTSSFTPCPDGRRLPARPSPSPTAKPRWRQEPTCCKTGSLQVTLLPSTVVTGGAKWYPRWRNHAPCQRHDLVRPFARRPCRQFQHRSWMGTRGKPSCWHRQRLDDLRHRILHPTTAIGWNDRGWRPTPICFERPGGGQLHHPGLDLILPAGRPFPQMPLQRVAPSLSMIRT